MVYERLSLLAGCSLLPKFNNFCNSPESCILSRQESIFFHNWNTYHITQFTFFFINWLKNCVNRGIGRSWISLLICLLLPIFLNKYNYKNMRNYN